MIIYGRQQGADGSIITGDAFFEEVEFAGPGGFTDNSNVNGCEVSGGCGPDVPMPRSAAASNPSSVRSA